MRWTPFLAMWALACPAPFAPLEGEPDDTAVNPEPEPEPIVRFSPAEARMHRLTEPEYRAAVHSVLGVTSTAQLPGDYRLHGFTSVGAAELSVPPADLDLYEASAWHVAGLALPDRAALTQRLGCDVSRYEDPSACVAPFAAELAHKAWHRPIDQHEVDDLVALFHEAAEITESPAVAGQAVVAAILQSPWFIFRVEVGVPDIDDPAKRRLTDHELAARLSSFITGTVPDPELLAMADAGMLSDPSILRAQAERLVNSEQARDGLTHFIRELLHLDRLATVDKDPDLFPHLTPALRTAMQVEIEALFVDVALDQDVDIREILTSDRAYVQPALGPTYGLDGLSQPTWVDLPSDQARGGLLGRAGFLALNAHAAATSPTHRGLFIQTRFLCGVVKPPPEGVDTNLPPVDPDVPTTLRERLTQHRDDDACRGCHQQMDPMGLALEHFDAAGAYRTHEWGLPIDASFDLNGESGVGAAYLGDVLVDSPRLPSCLVRQLYRHAIGQHEYDEEEPAIAELVDAFVANDHRLKSFIVDFVTHDVFRHVSPPDRQVCEEAGAERACETACGTGVQLCEDGHWRDCSAATAIPESCNGIDDDCDGEGDEVVRTCTAVTGPGIQVCNDAEWSTECEGPPRLPETCNGEDDDLDGEIDEDLNIDIAEVTWGQLSQALASCSVGVISNNGPCKAAIKRTCAASPCSVSGFGPVSMDYAAGTAELACLDSTESKIQFTTYTALKQQHAGCSGPPSANWGPACNAAISRWCGAQGMTTGFGPVEHSGDIAHVVCTPRASRLNLTYTELAPYSVESIGTCDGSTHRLGAACDAAIHGYCRAKGHRTGHGPLENYYDDLSVACLGTLEDR
ncbi:MAG: DUF1592 domain-containing protein [Myxococcota bacterium]